MSKNEYSVLTCDKCGREVKAVSHPDGWVAGGLVRDNQWKNEGTPKDLCIDCAVTLDRLQGGIR